MASQIESHLMANGNLSKKKIIIGNFLGGLAWGLGSVIGATIIVAIIVGVLKQANWIPFANDVADTVTRSVKSRPQED